MRRALLVVLLLAGCASRSELKENQALLAECRTDKVAAQGAQTSCEERYAKEVTRWENMDAVIADVIPGTLAEFKSEREQILKLVPDAARAEVGSYLDELTDAMGRGFQVLRDQSENTLLQLEVAQTKLDALQARTDNIGTATTTISSTLDGSLRESAEERRRMRQQALAMVGKVQAFDRAHLSVKESESRLKLNRNQRETIEQFHASLIAELSALGDDSGEPAASEPAPAAEPEVVPPSE
jgi:hypothetical protein